MVPESEMLCDRPEFVAFGENCGRVSEPWAGKAVEFLEIGGCSVESWKRSMLKAMWMTEAWLESFRRKQRLYWKYVISLLKPMELLPSVFYWDNECGQLRLNNRL